MELHTHYAPYWVQVSCRLRGLAQQVLERVWKEDSEDPLISWRYC